jgi:apolipoprotein N-acyltransferase
VAEDVGSASVFCPAKRYARVLVPSFAALATGLLLFLSDHPLRAWWLQFVAFVPFWLALAAHHRAGRRLWPLGTLLAIGNSVPLLFVLGLAPPIVVAVVAAVLQWMLIAMVAGRLFVRGPVLGALGAASAVTVLEIITWHAVPLFGTAQSFARPLAYAPAVIGFIAWTGVAGLVFVSTAVQALLAHALLEKRRAAPLLVAAGLVIAAAAADVVRWCRPLGEPVRVAAYGWGADRPSTDQGIVEQLDKVIRAAKVTGARLVVTPETGFGTGEDVAKAAAALGDLAKTHGVSLAIGVWHTPTRDNRIWFIGADGALAAEYRKTHLVPWVERYAAGDGTLARVAIGGTPFGGMICQDDNFTDLARAYGRDAMPLVVVPTNDWPSIRFAHFDNARLRAIENGYAIVRAASNGFSAIVSPRGEVLLSEDHIEFGRKLIVDEVPLGDGSATLYARLGDWPMLVLALLVGAVASRRRRPEPTVPPVS